MGTKRGRRMRTRRVERADRTNGDGQDERRGQDEWRQRVERGQDVWRQDGQDDGTGRTSGDGPRRVETGGVWARRVQMDRMCRRTREGHVQTDAGRTCEDGQDECRGRVARSEERAGRLETGRTCGKGRTSGGEEWKEGRTSGHGRVKTSAEDEWRRRVERGQDVWRQAGRVEKGRASGGGQGEWRRAGRFGRAGRVEYGQDEGEPTKRRGQDVQTDAGRRVEKGRACADGQDEWRGHRQDEGTGRTAGVQTGGTTLRAERARRRGWPGTPG